MFESLFGSGEKKPAQEPATEKQKQFAGKLGVKNADSLSKEEASEQIDKKLAARNRRGEGLLSHLQVRSRPWVMNEIKASRLPPPAE